MLIFNTFANSFLTIRLSNLPFFLGFSNFIDSLCLCSTSISVAIILSCLSAGIVMLKNRRERERFDKVAEAKKEMIANVTHDLRTPVTIMQGYTETLLMRIDSASKEDREDYLKIILENSEKLSILVNQLFDYAKLDVHQIKLEKKPFSIIELLERTKKEYQILASKKEIQLNVHSMADNPIVFADALLIKRVLQNLLDNALTYTPNKGTIDIKILTKGKQVMVEVADSGPGIEDIQKLLIFKRYEKDKNSRGAGLGLCIVKKILELHESAIQVNSKLGQGTKFIFSLPVH